MCDGVEISVLRILKTTNLVIIGLILVGIAMAANYWVEDPTTCPNSYQSQTCSGSDLVCGADGGITYCYDMSILAAPGSPEASNAGDTYQSALQGGFIVDCYAYDGSEPYCDNSGGMWCNRNNTCYSSFHRQTVCSADVYANSSCGICRTDGNDYLDCDTDTFDCEIRIGTSCGSSTGTYSECLVVGSGGTGNCTSTTNADCDNDDGDSNIDTCNGANGCEIISGASCGAGTGTYATDQCVGAVGNCTSAGTNLDCDDDDGDSNLLTCNGANGCEITDGGACSVGPLSGTYNGCTCYTNKQHFITGSQANYSTTIGTPLLWGYDYGVGFLVNLTSNRTTGRFLVNQSGCIIWPDGAQCSKPSTAGGGSSSNLTENITVVKINTTLSTSYLIFDTNGSLNLVMDDAYTPLEFPDIVTAQIEPIDDTYTVKHYSTNYGTKKYVEVRIPTTYARQDYFKFNIEQFQGYDVTSVTLNLAIDDNNLGAGESLNVTLYHLWANYSWLEETINGINQPDGEVDDLNPEWVIVDDSLVTGNYTQIDVTDIFSSENANQLSFKINATIASGSPIYNDYITFFTKEATQDHPYLEITYSVDTSSGNCFNVKNENYDDIVRLCNRGYVFSDSPDGQQWRCGITNQGKWQCIPTPITENSTETYEIGTSGNPYYDLYVQTLHAGEVIGFSPIEFLDELHLLKSKPFYWWNASTESYFLLRNRNISRGLMTGNIDVFDFNISTVNFKHINTSNISSNHYCNASDCYTIGDFLLDTTGGVSGTNWTEIKGAGYINQTQINSSGDTRYLRLDADYSLLSGNITIQGDKFTLGDGNDKGQNSITYADSQLYRYIYNRWQGGFEWYVSKDGGVSNLMVLKKIGGFSTLSVNASTYISGYLHVDGEITQAGNNVCLDNGTNCPISGTSNITWTQIEGAGYVNASQLENNISKVNAAIVSNISTYTGNNRFNSTSWNRSGTNVFLTNENDRVGIGTTDPLRALDIRGGVELGGDLIANSTASHKVCLGDRTICSGSNAIAIGALGGGTAAKAYGLGDVAIGGLCQTAPGGILNTCIGAATYTYTGSAGLIIGSIGYTAATGGVNIGHSSGSNKAEIAMSNHQIDLDASAGQVAALSDFNASEIFYANCYEGETEKFYWWDANAPATSGFVPTSGNLVFNTETGYMAEYNYSLVSIRVQNNNNVNCTGSVPNWELRINNTQAATISLVSGRFNYSKFSNPIRFSQGENLSVYSTSWSCGIGSTIPDDLQITIYAERACT